MQHQVIHLKERFPFLGKDGRDPNVTVYLPELMTDMGRGDWKRPCLVVCPGGGYGHCSQREAEPIALHYLPYGYNVFVIRYSVAPNRFPVQLQEVAAVMELIYENAENWHCDTAHIGIMGFSAGGHLAAHYSTCYDIPEVRQVFPDSKPVQASVLCYPVIFPEGHMGSFRNLLGAEPTPEQAEAFSCDKRVTDKTPPAFLWHTVEDTLVPVINSLRYATALTEHGIPFAMRVYPKGHHGLATVDEQTNNDLTEAMRQGADWLEASRKWLQTIWE